MSELTVSSKSYRTLVYAFKKFTMIYPAHTFYTKEDNKFWFDWLHNNYGMNYEVTPDNRSVTAINVTDEPTYILRLLEHGENF